jgi:kynurenine formamidase
MLYNGVPVADALDRAGSTRLAVGTMAAGIVSRGVLVDLPRLRGTRWLEPGEAVGPDELMDALAATRLSLDQGDVLLVRTGHGSRRLVDGPWDVSRHRAGLHPTVLPLLHERRVAAVGLDGDPDPMPAVVEGVRYPVLAIGTVAMGMPFLDSLALEDLAAACASEDRWEFLFVIAPLRIPGGTGSPVNPIAVL